MTNPYVALRTFLDTHQVPYQVYEHEPVYTSDQAAAIRGESLAAGAKSLLLKVGEEFVVVVLPGDQKLDSKKVKQLLHAKRLRFATPAEVVATMGCEIGACYPFGSIISLPTYVDTKLGSQAVIFFNPGVHDKTISMKWSDYQRVVDATFCDVTV